MYRAPFKYERRAIAIDPLRLENFLGNLGIAIPRKIRATVQPAPGIEQPANAATAPARIDEHRRAAVARPRVVAAHFHHPDGRNQPRSRMHVLRRGDTDCDDFAPRQSNGRGNFRKSRLRVLRAISPVIGSLWPQHPATAVSLE